jgi:hypothetical protein
MGPRLRGDDSARIDQCLGEPAGDEAAIVAPFEHVDVPCAGTERIGLLELRLRELPEVEGRQRHGGDAARRIHDDDVPGDTAARGNKLA